MLIIRTCKTKIKKAVTIVGFYGCILFSTILCFSAIIYIDTVKNNNYSVCLSLFSFDRRFMLTDTSFCAQSIILKGADGWLPMFIPIISAFAFIPLICDEHEAKSVRFEIFRTSKCSFYISRFVTALLCGALAVTIGYLIFIALVLLLFPHLSEYRPQQTEMFYENLRYVYPEISRGMLLPVVKTLGSVFVYGAFWAMPAVLLTAIVRNKYIVLCVPFFLKYALGQLCQKLQAQAVSDIQHTDMKLLEFTGVIHPDSLAHLSQLGDKKSVLIYSGLLVIAAFALYMFLQTRRLDSGE